MGVDSSECSIKVICRVRPLNQSEQKAGSKYIVKFLSEEALSVGNKNFTYDKVFRPDVTQDELYTKVAKPIVKDVLSGYNGTIFAYGQTASGKTHTMEGQLDDPDMEGIIPRIVGDIFSYIYEIDNDQIEFHIKVSYFEIYMDKIRDLLDVNKTNLIVHEDKNRVPFVKGATEHFVSCPKDVMQVIEAGKANRHVAVTNMNEHSSRSHSVFLINVKQVNNETDKKLSGKLYLVDLAGSEKVSKTGAEGSVLDEAKNINKSLSALGNVIAALADCSNFVPYRDSKLTRILQESLGGNAQTTMIICCSPASFNETETKSTLLFGSRAKTIKNTVMVNEELTAEEWKRRYEKERERSNKMKIVIQRFENELSRWRNGETVPDEDRLKMNESTDTQSSLDNIINKVGTEKNSSVTEEERLRWESEKNQLYQQLDDKDEELSSTLEMLEKYKEQLVETEDQIKSYIRERDSSTAEISRLEGENESSRSEIKEVFGALSELAQNYDQKVSECGARKEEIDALNEDHKKAKEYSKLLEMEVSQLKENVVEGKRRLNDIQNTIYHDLSDLAATLNSNIKIDVPRSFDSLDDGVGVLRLVFNKLKTEVTLLVDKSASLTSDLTKQRERNEDLEKDLATVKLQANQLEVKIRSVSESLRETEAKKQSLQQEFDSLNEQCSQLKTKEQMYMVQLGELEQKEHEVASTTQMKQALERQMQLHTEQHSKQIAELRAELITKEKNISDVSETLEELKVIFETLKLEHEQLQESETKKTTQLAQVCAKLESSEQSRKDLKQLEDVVARELQMLHNLRKHFMKDITDRIKKTAGKQDDDDSYADAKTQRQKIIFLENNLDQITKVHKQLVRDNTDLRGELPKLEKRLKATMERIRALEIALRDAKEGAMRDRKRYQQEVDRIKEVVRQKNLLRKGHSATIVKPIRACQTHTASASTVVRPGNV